MKPRLLEKLGNGRPALRMSRSDDRAHSRDGSRQLAMRLGHDLLFAFVRACRDKHAAPGQRLPEALELDGIDRRRRRINLEISGRQHLTRAEIRERATELLVLCEHDVEPRKQRPRQERARRHRVKLRPDMRALTSATGTFRALLR